METWQFVYGISGRLLEDFRHLRALLEHFRAIPRAIQTFQGTLRAY